MLNISHIEDENYVNGDGCRFVIWFQGCTLGCPECWNKYTWSNDAKLLISPEELFSKIRSNSRIAGVTFTGGEPFQQLPDALRLARMIKSNTDLTLHVFTGYELNELVGLEQKELLTLADVIVSGRFNPSKENNNQKVSKKENNLWEFNNTNIEIDINDDCDLIVTGYPDDVFLQNLEEVHNAGI